MAAAPRTCRQIRVLAGASGVGFILAICGSNAMTPLLPGYVETHDFGPAAASVLFATYFIALIIVLQIAGASVELFLFPGRFLTGASVGCAPVPRRRSSWLRAARVVRSSSRGPSSAPVAVSSPPSR